MYSDFSILFVSFEVLEDFEYWGKEMLAIVCPLAQLRTGQVRWMGSDGKLTSISDDSFTLKQRIAGEESMWGFKINFIITKVLLVK